MTSRDRMILMAFMAIAATAAFWFLALAPKRERVDTANAQIVQAQSQLDTAESQLKDATAAKQRYLENYGAVAALGKAVPDDDRTDTLIYQLQQLAKRAGVNFQSIVLRAGAAPAAGAAATTGAGATANATVTATLPPGASVGSANFPTMPFTLTFNGSFFKLQKFLAGINNLTTIRKGEKVRVRGRLLQIDGVGLQPSSQGFPNITAKLSATAYLLPKGQGLTAGATPSSPSGTSTNPAQ